MTFEGIPPEDLALWREYHKAQKVLLDAFVNFSRCASRDEILKKALTDDRGDRFLAFEYGKRVYEEELKTILKELLYTASFASGWIHNPREIILRLPRKWLVENIEAAAESLNIDDDPYPDDRYRRLLELYNMIDVDLTNRLAKQAIAHSDPHVREAGLDFLEE